MESHEATHQGKVLILLPCGHERSRSDHPVPPRIRTQGPSAPPRRHRPASALLWAGQGGCDQMGRAEPDSGGPSRACRTRRKPRRWFETGRCGRSRGCRGTRKHPDRDELAAPDILPRTACHGHQQHPPGQFETGPARPASSSRLFDRRHGIACIRTSCRRARMELRNHSWHQ